MNAHDFEWMVMQIAVYALLAAAIYVVIGGVENPMDAISHSIEVLTK